jgi:hypothetical protein
LRTASAIIPQVKSITITITITITNNIHTRKNVVIPPAGRARGHREITFPEAYSKVGFSFAKTNMITIAIVIAIAGRASREDCHDRYDYCEKRLWMWMRRRCCSDG